MGADISPIECDFTVDFMLGTIIYYYYYYYYF